jgi:predicted nucleic acid-binding protein
MSRFLLDTNILSEFNRTGAPEERVRQWVASMPLESLHVSVITVGEIRFGIELLPPGKRRAQLEQWMAEDFPSWFERLYISHPQRG